MLTYLFQVSYSMKYETSPRHVFVLKIFIIHLSKFLYFLSFLGITKDTEQAPNIPTPLVFIFYFITPWMWHALSDSLLMNRSQERWWAVPSEAVLQNNLASLLLVPYCLPFTLSDGNSCHVVSCPGKRPTQGIKGDLLPIVTQDLSPTWEWTWKRIFSQTSLDMTEVLADNLIDYSDNSESQAKQLLGNKCFLFQMLSFGITCYAAIQN